MTETLSPIQKYLAQKFEVTEDSLLEVFNHPVGCDCSDCWRLSIIRHFDAIIQDWERSKIFN